MATRPADQKADGDLDLRLRDDLCRLEGWADSAPRLSSRADMPDPLTTYWLDVVRLLIGQAKKVPSIVGILDRYEFGAWPAEEALAEIRKVVG